MDAIEHTHGEVQETTIILLDIRPSPGVSCLPGYITLVTCTCGHTYCMHQIHTHACACTYTCYSYRHTIHIHVHMTWPNICTHTYKLFYSQTYTLHSVICLRP